MGRAVLKAIDDTSDCALAAAIIRHKSQTTLPADTASADASEAIRRADVLIDFTTAETSVRLSAIAADAQLPVVIATTGFSPDQDAAIAAAAKKIAIVKSANLSVGVSLLAAFVRQAAGVLKAFDIQILDMHHRKKVDAPSGTALLLARAAANAEKASGSETESSAGFDQNRIGFASLRGGTVVGEHSVIFAGPYERLTLSHTAEDRAIFANGALVAARWLQGRAPGLYDMQDVLGLS